MHNTLLSNELTNWLIFFFACHFINVMKWQYSVPQTLLRTLILPLLYFYPHTFNYHILLPFLQASFLSPKFRNLMAIKHRINSLLLEAFLVGWIEIRLFDAAVLTLSQTKGYQTQRRATDTIYRVYLQLTRINWALTSLGKPSRRSICAWKPIIAPRLLILTVKDSRSQNPWSCDCNHVGLAVCVLMKYTVCHIESSLWKQKQLPPSVFRFAILPPVDEE